MRALAAAVNIVLVVIGYSRAGLLGALTGMVLGAGVSGGTAIFVKASNAALSDNPDARTRRQFSGTLAALACAAGAWLGGWRWGWAGGAIGYLIGTFVGSIGVALLGVTHVSSRAVSPEPGPALVDPPGHDAEADVARESPGA